MTNCGVTFSVRNEGNESCYCTVLPVLGGTQMTLLRIFHKSSTRQPKLKNINHKVMMCQSPLRAIKPMMIGCDAKWRDVQPFKPVRRGSLVGLDAKAASAASEAASIQKASCICANRLLAYLDTNYLPLETSASSEYPMMKSKSLSSLDQIASKRRSSRKTDPLSLSDHFSSRRSDSMDIRKQITKTKSLPKRRGSKEADAGMGNDKWSTPLKTIDEFQRSCFKKEEKKSKSRGRRSINAPACNIPSTVKLSSRLNTPSTVKLNSRKRSNSDRPSGRTAANKAVLACALLVIEGEDSESSGLK
jgi:hypothetical protein